MAQNEVVGLSAELKVEQALAELKRLGPGADKEAKAIAASLGKALKDSEKAAKKLGDEMAKAGKQGKAGLDQAVISTAALGDGGSKALKALGPLGGVLGRISPEAGAAASSIAGLTSAFEGFGVEGGLLAGAVGASLPLIAAGALAVGELSGVMDDYTSASKAASAAHTAFSAALAPMSDAIEAAKKEQDRLNAALDSGSAKKYLAISDLSAVADAKEAEATKGLREEKAALMDVLSTSANMDNFEGQIAQNRIASIDKEIGAVHAKAGELARLSVTNYTLRGAIEGASTATTHHAAASKDLVEELLKEAKAAQSASDAFAAHLAEVEASAAAADALVAKSADFRLTESAKLYEQQGRDLEEYIALAETGGRTVEEINAGIAELQTNQQEEFTAKVAEESAKRAEIEKAAAEKAAAAQAEATARTVGMITDSAQLAASVLSSVQDSAQQAYDQSLDLADRLTGQLVAGEEYYTEGQQRELQQRIEAQKDAARKAFKAQKAAGVAVATVQLFVAEAQAVASAPWPYNVPAIIEAGVAGGAAVAGAASVPEPSFHQGYAPDEQSARILRREAVMSPTATTALGGKDRIERLNDGQTRAPAYSGPAPIVVGHRVFGTLIKRELVSGVALKAAINGDRIVGHRTNRRGTTG